MQVGIFALVTSCLVLGARLEYDMMYQLVNKGLFYTAQYNKLRNNNKNLIKSKVYFNKINIKIYILKLV